MAGDQVAVAFDAQRVEAVLFDFGNTLIPFGPREFGHQCDALEAALRSMPGEVAATAIAAVRDEQIRRPYGAGYRENRLPYICAELIERVCGRTATAHEVDALIETRYRAFLEVIAPVPASTVVLDALAARYRLGLVSNYPCARSILDSVAALGWAHRFETAVVSGAIGWCKPHAAPFRAALDALGVAPERALYVGDNWLADVQGARRLGMQAVWVREHVPHERFDPAPGDLQPHATLEHLGDLPALLACG